MKVNTLKIEQKPYGARIVIGDQRAYLNKSECGQFARDLAQFEAEAELGWSNAHPIRSGEVDPTP